MSATTFNPFLSSFSENPYPVYARMRREDAVHQSFFGSWCVFRHKDCHEILNDPGTFSSDPTHWTGFATYPVFSGERQDASALVDLTKGMMIFRDDEAHRRLRQIVSRPFTPSALSHLELWVTRRTQGCLSTAGVLEGVCAWDFMETVAEPLPVMVILHLLGLPLEDWPFLRGLSRRVRHAFEPMVVGGGLRSSRAAAAELTSYFRELAKSRTSRGIVGHALALAGHEEALSAEEQLANAFLLFFAGHETTVNLLGNGIVALLGAPGGWDGFLESKIDEKFIVEELVRFDSPFQLVYRFALDDACIGGKHIAKGEQVLVFLASGNRDSDAFSEPDRLDFKRFRARGERHLSFGYGPHFCLGAALARLEARVVLRVLRRSFASIELGETLHWKSNILLRGLSRLTLRTTAHRALPRPGPSQNSTGDAQVWLDQ